MHWSDVQLFLAVVRGGSVRAAAQTLRLNPSTVSRRVAALEHALGVRLFERTSGGLVLTAPGRAMLQAGERVDGELEELGRKIVGQDRRLGGVVRVTLPGSFMAVVHRAVADIVARFPAIEVELLTADTLLDVDGRQADVAIRVAAQPPEHLVGRRVGALAGALYATVAYLVEHPAPLDSADHAWVEWDRRLASKPAFAWLHQRFPHRRVVARGLSTADVRQAVVSGVGVGALPCLVGDVEPSLVRLLDAPRETWSSVWILTHRELKPAARVQAVISRLTAELRLERARIEGASTRTPRVARAARS